MATYKVGEMILIPVSAGNGAFSGERLIAFDTLDGPISGFIGSDQVVTRNGKTLIRAEILGVAPSHITVRLHGSFFTTTGLAHIDRHTSYLRAA
jgi:hypothetical protein